VYDSSEPALVNHTFGKQKQINEFLNLLIFTSIHGNLSAVPKENKRNQITTSGVKLKVMCLTSLKKLSCYRM